MPFHGAHPETIKGTLDTAVERYGAAPWMAHDGEVRSFTQLGEQVERIAGALLGLGVEPGDRVGLFLGNCFEWLQIEYAVAALGAWLVPLNTWFRERELEHILGQSAISTLIWGEDILGHDMRPLLATLVPELDDGRPGCWHSARFPALRAAVGVGAGPWPPGVRPWTDLLEAQPADARSALAQRARAVRAEDVAIVMYTSGTTGSPKGALLRHRSIVRHIGTWTEHLQLGASDRSIMASPLFWTFGCTINALVPLQAGSMVVLEDRFRAESFLEDIVRYGCTHLQGVPTQYEMALEHPDSARFDLSTLRLIQIGGSASAEGLARRLLQRAPDARMVSAYGLTEAIAVSTWTDLADPLEDVMRTVGHAADDLEIELRDPATSEPVAAGEVGEMWIRGEVMAGYLDEPEATAAALVDGWLRTGDLAIADARGYLAIAGRETDAFKRGGMNVYPVEVEALLAEHPRVASAALIGVPDPQLGHVGVAFVVSTGEEPPPAEEIIAYCAGRVARYKVPAHVRIVAELPVTPSGKVQKFRLLEAWRQDASVR